MCVESLSQKMLSINKLMQIGTIEPAFTLFNTRARIDMRIDLLSVISILRSALPHH